MRVTVGIGCALVLTAGSVMPAAAQRGTVLPESQIPRWCAYCEGYNYEGELLGYHAFWVFLGEACEAGEEACFDCAGGGEGDCWFGGQLVLMSWWGDPCYDIPCPEWPDEQAALLASAVQRKDIRYLAAVFESAPKGRIAWVPGRNAIRITGCGPGAASIVVDVPTEIASRLRVHEGLK